MYQIIETAEDGSLTIPSQVLGIVKSPKRYLVEKVGKSIHVAPEMSPENKETQSSSAWIAGWNSIVERFEISSRTDVSALDALSAMRNKC